MEPVFSRFATLDTLLDEGATVVYAGYRLDVKNDITIGEAFKSMTELFPELCNAEWELDVANSILHIYAKPMKVVRRKRDESLATEEREYPTRKFIEAEDGVCRDAHHDIIVLGSIPATEEEGRIDEFYCPTCNKFWREA